MVNYLQPTPTAPLKQPSGKVSLSSCSQQLIGKGQSLTEYQNEKPKGKYAHLGYGDTDPLIIAMIESIKERSKI